MAFFFGLILASVFIVAKQVRNGTLTGLALLIGIAIAAAVLLLNRFSKTPTRLSLSLRRHRHVQHDPSGISGSFILILMGNYGLVIGAIGNIRDSKLPCPFWSLWLGCAVGLLGFARALSYVLG